MFHTCASVHAHVYVCMYTCMYWYACMYVCMHACMYVCVCMYVCICMYVCMYVCLSESSMTSSVDCRLECFHPSPSLSSAIRQMWVSLLCWCCERLGNWDVFKGHPGSVSFHGRKGFLFRAFSCARREAVYFGRGVRSREQAKLAKRQARLLVSLVLGSRDGWGWCI